MNQPSLDAIRTELARQDEAFAAIRTVLTDLGAVLIKVPQDILDLLTDDDAPPPPVTIPRFPAPQGVRA